MIAIGSLDESDAAAVRTLLDEAEAADQVTPVSEQAALRVRPSTANHLLSRDRAGSLLGYAQIDDEGTAELVVHPDQRRRGVGTQLAEALVDAGPDDSGYGHTAITLRPRPWQPSSASSGTGRCGG